MTRRTLTGVIAAVVLAASVLTATSAAAAAPRPKPRTLTLPPPAQMVVQGGEAPPDVVAAVEFAAHRWAQYITSVVPIVIRIDWEPLGDQIGGVGGSGAMHDFDGAREPGTWYPMPLADALAGEDLYPGYSDVQLTLNSDMAWHTGTDPAPDELDLISTAMHEIGHGLGFNGWIRRDPETGEGEVGAGIGEGMPGIFDRFVAAAGSPILDLPSPSQELGDALVGGQLTWTGPLGIEENGGTPPVLASDPGPWGRYPHLNDDAYPNRDANSLMTPIGEHDADRYPGPVAVGMLSDMGWPLGPVALSGPRTTDASCPPGVPEDGFTDVDPGNTHESAIDCLVAWGITSGTGPSTYSPGNAVTRAQMASFVARLIDESGGELPEGDDAFTDDEGDAYAPHEGNINRLAAAGIVTGRGDGTYDPGSPVTRAQMATFLIRAANYRIDDTLEGGADFFWDDDTSVHVDNVDAAATWGFTGGRADGSYGPGAPVQRDQMASFLTRVLDLLVEEGLTSYPG